ncbi:MAG TPA: hypothetical protein VFE78_22225 [Gemmataceae bacterium]|jgi:hypothetical protein|nr:hypothetical protein [Gemmataceae bacterium]
MENVSDETAPDKPKRGVSLWESSPGEWVLTLTEFHPRAATDTHYRLVAIPSDLGRAFRLRKLEADGGEVYHVNLTSDRPACDCKGHLAHGHCKHVESLTALQAAGKLDAVKVPEAKPAPAPKPGGKVVNVPATLIDWDDL